VNNIDEELVLAHFIVSDDVERSRRFYSEVLGGRVAFSGPGGLTYVALSNSWIIINGGGGPTDDKPSVTLETPRDPDRVSSFVNIRSKTSRPCTPMERQGCEFPDAAETAPVRDPLLHSRPRRSSDRSGANHPPRRRLDARSLAIECACRGVRVNIGAAKAQSLIGGA
jgi:catechol 2,3-dioxygenase-like lactoylglutathione lyase family enzyme